MDIKRGDTVYHRGKVWTVKDIKPLWDMSDIRILISRPFGDVERRYWARSTDLRRVEQVR